MSDEFFPTEYNLKEVFDTLIRPSLQNIVNICDEYNLPMLACFQYMINDEEAELCTYSVLPLERTTEQLILATNSLTES